MRLFRSAMLLSLVSCTGDHAAIQELDFEQIRQITGVEGTINDGQYKISVPQPSLDVTVDGFKIIPAMGLTSWAAFASAPEGATVMGDLVVLETEIGAVEGALVEAGLTVTALHNHFVRDNPKVMFMHIGGVGPAAQLARGVRKALDEIERMRQGRDSSAASSVESTFDTQEIDRILGHSGGLNNGVYKVTIGRPDVELVDHGVEVTSFMGFNTWAAFQGIPERTAVAGDFVMLEHEVASVIQSLVKNNIEVVALHNHMVHEQPRVFFLHYWGVGPSKELSEGLREALDQTGTGREE